MERRKGEGNNKELEAQVAALSETFERWGWDPQIPKIISQWGSFNCTAESFTLITEGQIPSGVKGGTGVKATTEIELSIRTPITEDPVRMFRIRQEADGKFFQIQVFPVREMRLNLYENKFDGTPVATVLTVYNDLVGNSGLYFGEKRHIGFDWSCNRR